MKNLEKALEYKNTYALKKSEQIAREIKENVQNHLYDDGLVLL